MQKFVPKTSSISKSKAVGACVPCASTTRPATSLPPLLISEYVAYSNRGSHPINGNSDTALGCVFRSNGRTNDRDNEVVETGDVVEDDDKSSETKTSDCTKTSGKKFEDDTKRDESDARQKYKDDVRLSSSSPPSMESKINLIHMKKYTEFVSHKKEWEDKLLDTEPTQAELDLLRVEGEQLLLALDALNMDDHAPKDQRENRKQHAHRIEKLMNEHC